MSEFESTPPPEPPFWEGRELLGEATVEGRRRRIYLPQHLQEEAFRQGNPLLPIRPEGRRTYVYARPYVEIPDITASIEMEVERPRRTNEVGRVQRVRRSPDRPLDLGNAQAWHYPEDGVIVLWECYLNESYRQPDPRDDPLLAVVWNDFERSLIQRFRAASRLLTLAWEPHYETGPWRCFLLSRGYRPWDGHIFSKQLRKP